MRRAPVLSLALSAAWACSDPRVPELAQELAALKESRTPRASFERMRSDADDAERGVQALEQELEALSGELDGALAAAASLEAAFQAEVAQNAELNREIQEGQQRLRDATARLAELETQVSIQRARAQTVKDQAASLARELRPDDPEWARRLRIQTLQEFLREVAQSWPRDPVLAPAARQALPADEREATRVGAELAQRIRDRVSEVYGLGENGTANAEAPAVAAEPGES